MPRSSSGDTLWHPTQYTLHQEAPRMQNFHPGRSSYVSGRTQKASPQAPAKWRSESRTPPAPDQRPCRETVCSERQMKQTSKLNLSKPTCVMSAKVMMTGWDL